MTNNSEHRGKFEPATDEEEIVLRLNADLPAEAANLIRKLNISNGPLLGAIADMLDGDPNINPGLTKQYSYRLKLTAWGRKGRKPKGSTAKAKNNAGYKPKQAPIKVSDAMLASKVKRLRTEGMNRTNAIAETALYFKVSRSKVEKAYDRNRSKIKAIGLTNK